MLLEIKLKYYNSDLKIGFNTWREMYDCMNEVWFPAKDHLGRVVYGPERIPYKKIKAGIDQFDFVIQEYSPF